ncbi:MAG: MDR family MFS transporter [Dehalococcoidia bacterium]
MNAPLADTLPLGRRLTIMGAVMLGLFLSAMDQTIVGTALPRIIAELSGLSLYSWVFTSYMLTSTTFVPIIGKAGDVFGRKNLFLIGIVIFLVGSILSGVSQSMVQLIVFRGIQGAGGGFIFANAFAITGDLFSPAERGRYMGLLSGVFGLASVIGPLIGGGITDHLNWRWVFYVNIPLGLAALAVVALVLPGAPGGTARRRIDYLGSALLAAAISPMLLAFSWAGQDYAWTDGHVVFPLLGSALASAAFVVVELRADDPIIPFGVFRNTVFAASVLITFVTGMAMFSGTVYIPLFMQGVLNFSATNAGLVLTPMTLSLVAGSIVSGQIISRTGSYRWLTLIGLIIGAFGLYMLSTMDAHSSQVAGMRDMSILGLGMGFTMPSLVLASQNALPQTMIGVSTSLTQFARSVGGVIGVAIMGSLLTSRLEDELASGLPPQVQQQAPEPLLASLRNPRILLDDGALEALRTLAFEPVFGADAAHLFPESIASLREGLATSITEVFFLSMCIMAAAAILTIWLRDLPLRTTVAAVNGEPERALPAAGAVPASAPGATPRPAPGPLSAELRRPDGL